MARIRGFSLIEIMIVALVLVILAVLFLGWTRMALDKAKQVDTFATNKVIANAVNAYQLDNDNNLPNPAGVGVPTAIEDLRPYLEPIYISSLPTVDGWGRPIRSAPIWRPCAAGPARWSR